ncbi:OPT/YSL family transporter [Senimuribacter intestinalis]|uniref:OPT/YSL family transporter n=1 Tax=Senimuribacter intestinalis TaxID=2941507 RepID=UPI00203D4320|nr:OPT/YSL family transporter [Senimuribacter intestinalis]
MNNTESKQNNILLEEQKEIDRHKITADQMPKVKEPAVFVVAIIVAILGCIVGLQVQIHTGTTPDTSIVGAIFAILIAQIPLRWLKPFKNIHRQNLVQTTISGATFASANCMFLTMGIPVIMGWPQLMVPMLIGATLATIVDATILYKSFGSPMFPAEGAWPPGIAVAESIYAMADKGKRALLLLVGSAAGWIGAMIGIPMDLVGVVWVGSLVAMGAFGVGALLKGILSTNEFSLTFAGHTGTFATDIFGSDFSFADSVSLSYLGHGAMIGAGIISLLQCARILFKKEENGTSAASRFGTSLSDMKNALSKGFIAYIVIAIGLAIATGLYYEMGIVKLIAWVIFAAVAALVSELIVGVSTMHSGWFPGFATALLFLIIGMMIGFPTLPLAILAGFTAATGPAFSDMGNDLKAGWILRGKGADMELEKVGRKQQYYAELLGFGVAFVMVAIFAKGYFNQGMFAPINFVYQSTIEAGSTVEVMKWLAIWAIPGALIQLLGGNHQAGILFATGFLVGWTEAGVVILIAISIRAIVIHKNPERDSIFAILGAGALVGSALRDFSTSMLGLFKK